MTVVRLGEVRMPVDVKIELADGQVLEERWDGRDRWRRFAHQGQKLQ